MPAEFITLCIGLVVGGGGGLLVGFCWGWSNVWGFHEGEREGVAARQARAERSAADDAARYAATQTAEYNSRRDFTDAWIKGARPPEAG